MIRVESPGPLTTVQDLGRPGYGAIGVSASGAADSVAFRAGNLLLGNPANAAGLEMTLIGGRFYFEQAATVALTGAVTPWRAFDVAAGATVDVGPLHGGVRAYLCVGGGIDAPLFLGSASTHVMTGLGGRPLRKGDLLRIGDAPGRRPRVTIRREALVRLAPRKTLRVTYGPQIHWFTDEQRATFVSASYRVTQEANRMGLRLEGAPMIAADSSHMITEGVALGAIQTPACGQPIILFVEQQTTGGYPKIANVIWADLSSAGQLRPGDEVRFEWVSIETARAVLKEQARLLTPEELFQP